ncbi:hypothetical protein RD792_009880 [Penstemon davidsonii]|uniref:Germin-like protein n=1 Tax=Penstemon davidsonii TaxID=160366 RepID=A0ABR0D1R2_9LAMI|nr:hypothetical protein RD792_009880 [Penstemon davidsonii]
MGGHQVAATHLISEPRRIAQQASGRSIPPACPPCLHARPAHLALCHLQSTAAPPSPSCTLAGWRRYGLLFLARSVGKGGELRGSLPQGGEFESWEEQPSVVKSLRDDGAAWCLPSGGSINPLHIHPRASELLFVLEGSLEVGFVDTTGKLFTRTLQLGDMFVFPKGLVHYQYNADLKQPATAVSAFGSASAGTVSLPTTLFATNVDDIVLAESFKTDVGTIQKLKAGLGSIK